MVTPVLAAYGLLIFLPNSTLITTLLIFPLVLLELQPWYPQTST